MEGWEESPEYLERVEILKKIIPKYKTTEIKQEIQDFEQLLYDIKNSDNKLISVSEYMKKVKSGDSGSPSNRSSMHYTAGFGRGSNAHNGIKIHTEVAESGFDM